METNSWYTIEDTQEIVSPALIVYPDRIEKNIQNMIKIAGDVAFLRPHVKTYKMAEIIQMQMRHGIYKFKCATIAEAELLGQCNAKDVLLAIQPTGANIARFMMLRTHYPNTKFSAIVDDLTIVEQIIVKAKQQRTKVSLWVDINNGMNRTGIKPGAEAFNLYTTISNSEYLTCEGLHAYDGHIRDSDFTVRKTRCDAAFENVEKLKDKLENSGHAVPTIVAGGSPSFEIHAKRKNVEASPGTTLLWDAGYASSFPESPMLPAAVLITRLISKPTSGVLCFDLGHKAVASEMSFPRVQFLNLEQSEQQSQSEEHLVVTCSTNEKHNLGSVYYAIPMHICPTVAKYKYVLTAKEGKITDSWEVAARNYKISI